VDAKRALEGLTVIAVGCILLANTTGALPWSVWISILSLWPVALVAAGIDIIGKSTEQTWLRVLASLLVIGALAYGALAMPWGSWGFPFVLSVDTSGQQTYTFDEPPIAGVSSGTASIDAGATRLEMASGDRLATLRATAAPEHAPELTVSRSGGTADVSVEFPRRGVPVFGVGSNERTAVTLERDLRWKDIVINAGAAQADVDLSEMRVDQVTANAGASTFKIDLPRQGDSALTVNGGAVGVVVTVPRDADVTLDTQGFPLATSLPSGFERSSGGIGSGSWRRRGTGAKVGIELTGGAASIEIRDY